MKSKRKKKSVRLELDKSDIILIALIVLAFPVGLYMMWKDDCAWNRWIKAAISVAWAAVIVCAIVVLPSIENYQYTGNVQIVTRKSNKAMLGPAKPEGIPDTVQIVKNASETSSLISQPTPTPDPIMVYCNDNGVYYHLQGCRYVYPTTPRVRLLAALQAGKTACPECKPPNEMTY